MPVKLFKHEDDIFKCLILSEQLSKTGKYEVLDHIKQIKAADCHIGEARKIFAIFA